MKAIKRHSQSYSIQILVINFTIIMLLLLFNVFLRTGSHMVIHVNEDIKYLQVVNSYEQYYVLVGRISLIIVFISMAASIYFLMKQNKNIDKRLKFLVDSFDEVGLSKINETNSILTDYDLQVINSWNRSVGEIENLNEMREKYFKNMIHDLKTPIQILKLNLRMLKLEKDDNEHVVAIEEELNVLEKSVTNYLSIEKITFFEKKNLTNIDFDVYFKNINERYKHMDYKIIYHNISNSQVVQTDESMFTRIAENLIENAIKYGIDNYLEVVLTNEGIKFINSVDECSEIGNIFSGERQFSMLGNGLGAEIINTYIKLLNWKIESEKVEKQFIVNISFE